MKLYKKKIYVYYRMKAKPTERKCKDCEVIIPYIPRKIRCIECYKKYTNFSIKFINDE
jgi:hypothetical protein